MARIAELFIILNAAGGIAAFLGFRAGGRKLGEKIRGIGYRKDETKGPDENR